MNERIEKYFKVGTIQWMSYPPERCDLLETVKRLAMDPYFSAIEICHMESEETRKTVRDILRQTHMTVCFGAQPSILSSGANPNDPDEEKRQKAEAILRACVDEAEYLGAKGIAFLAGHWTEESKDICYAQLLKTTGNLCDYARAKGMMIELEVFDYDMDKCALIGPAPLAKAFAEDMRKKYDNFGLLVDLSHFPTTYETSRDVIPLLAPYITHLHIGNAVVKPGCPAYGDKHPGFGFPDSANDTEELIDFLREVKAAGLMKEDDPMVLSFEIKPQTYEEPQLLLNDSKRVLNTAWAKA